MKAFDSIGRAFILAQGTGVRWLREELAAAGVSIPVTEGCLNELLRLADDSVRGSGARPYVEELRRELARQADFIRRWTDTDEILSSGPRGNGQSLVEIARKYALPRRWKLTEPVATEYRRLHPAYSQWTRHIDIPAASQAWAGPPQTDSGHQISPSV